MLSSLLCIMGLELNNGSESKSIIPLVVGYDI